MVFENRFPSLAGDSGRCEVVCFTSDHDSSFADLTDDQAALVLAAWTDRTAALAELDQVAQVFCFENRGAEIGVTLGHPHGQIYGYPFVTPRTELMVRSAVAHRAETGRNLFEDVVARELADGDRVVLEGEHWVAFVPYAAHWPYEVHLYPRRRVADFRGLDDAARTEFPRMYLELLRRFDRIFGPDEPPTPYIAAWHQAPFRAPGREEFALHLELFTIRRTTGKLKFLAGSESGMGAFINDVPPESAAQRLREVVEQVSSTPKKYLVTGGAGYVGSVVATHLLEAGHAVTVLDDLSTGFREGVRGAPSSSRDASRTPRSGSTPPTTPSCTSPRRPRSASPS